MGLWAPTLTATARVRQPSGTTGPDLKPVSSRAAARSEAGAATAQMPPLSTAMVCGTTTDSILETFKLSVGLEGATPPAPPSDARDIDLERRPAPARIISALNPARRT